MDATEKTALLTQIDEECNQQGVKPLAGKSLEDIVGYLPVEQTSIADVVPGTVTSEGNGTAINTILAALRATGILAAPA